MEFQKYYVVPATSSMPQMVLLLVPTLVLLFNNIIFSSRYVQETVSLNSSQVLGNIKEWTYTLDSFTTVTTLLLLLLIFYLIYYYIKCGVPCVIAHPKSLLAKVLLDRCPILRRTFFPSILCPFPDLQSLSLEITDTLKINMSPIQLKTKTLDLPDGEQVCISEPYEQLSIPHDVVVVIVPGYTGCHTTDYVLKIVERCLRAATWPVVYTDRGKGGLALRIPKFFHAGINDGLTIALDTVIDMYPNKKVVVIGISFGGMVACNTINAYHRREDIHGLMLLSCPLNAPKTNQHLNTLRVKTLYSRPFGSRVKKLLKENRQVFLNNPWSTQLFNNLMLSNTITDIDDKFISPMYGYSSSDQYYSDICLSKALPNLTIPTIILNAEDDPNYPAKSFPLDTIRSNPNICMVTTLAGGHFGYAGLLWPVGGYNFAYQFVTESLEVFKSLKS